MSEQKPGFADNLLAALMQFTRLPWWRLKNVPQDSFKHVVTYWSITGWFTGGVMALVAWGACMVMPQTAAVVLALASRLLLTGAFHEDGLADFFDGFGGGHDRESVLRIMKDSHIGSYGVIGLAVYFLLATTLLGSLPQHILPLALLVSDSLSKMCVSRIIGMMPYARTAEQSKVKTVYSRQTAGEIITTVLGGFLPLAVVSAFAPGLSYGWYLWLSPFVVSTLLMLYVKKRLQGYTGDCCGALFLLTELATWMTLTIIHYI